MPHIHPQQCSPFFYLDCLSVLPCFALSYLILSCLVLPCLVLSYIVLPCLALSCLVLSCLALSCLGLAWLGLPWLGLAWLGLAWLGLLRAVGRWLGPASLLHNCGLRTGRWCAAPLRSRAISWSWTFMCAFCRKCLSLRVCLP